MTLKRQLGHQCKQFRIQRVAQAVHDAEEAAAMHDTRRRFNIVKSLCPKQRSSVIRLRGPAGRPMGGSEECQQFCPHFGGVYAAALPEPSAPSLILREMPFDLSELQYALEHASIHKAVGPEALPNIYLHAFAPALTEWLSRMWQSLRIDQPFQVPQSWKDAWLCLLAKRPVRTPADVRPIALTDSLGKLVLGLITTKLRNI